MNVLETLHLSGALHEFSQGLLVPVVILLLILAAYAIYTIGAFIVEIVLERRKYTVEFPKLISAIDAAEMDGLDKVIDDSGLLDSQRAALHELVRYSYLPQDALTDVAKRLLADESERYEKALGVTEAAVKIAPMLGLMGTLIPLGPGIVGLGDGDLHALSSSLLMAFDTTVAGLVVAVVCFLVAKVRKRWYRSYLISLEGAMDTILEKVENLRAQEAGDE